MNEELEKRLNSCKLSLQQPLEYTMRGLSQEGKDIYPLHSRSHSQRVENLLRKIVDVCNNNIRAEKISEIEEFILYCSAWIHDLGNIISRKDHNIHTVKILKKYGNQIDGIRGYENIISWVCCTHTFNKGSQDPINSLPEKFNISEGIKIHTRYLAAIFRLADACDLERSKAPPIIFDILSESMSETSLSFWKAHNNVYSSWIENDAILVTFIEKSPNDEFILTYLKSQLELCIPWLEQYHFPVKIIKTDYPQPDESWRQYLQEE